MDEETVNEQVHDVSTQGRVVSNDGSLLGEMSINESNQDDNDKSLQKLSAISLTKESYDELEDNQHHNKNCLKHVFKVPPNLFGSPHVPEPKRERYQFLYKNQMHDIVIDNMLRETENEYVIMKYNCKELQELGDDTPEYEELLTKNS
eukprot:15337749-Ditylum_brightwellii.AAC.1